jgi:hypothetical protein
MNRLRKVAGATAVLIWVVMRKGLRGAWQEEELPSGGRLNVKPGAEEATLGKARPPACVEAGGLLSTVSEQSA